MRDEGAGLRIRQCEVHAGAGRDLRTMILYGPQVTNSAVFREQQHLFNFYICGIAEHSPDDPFYGRLRRDGADSGFLCE
jgi:hypothetical protein